MMMMNVTRFGDESLMMLVVVVVTFEVEDLKASFDFFKIPGKTSESLLRLKVWGLRIMVMLI